MKGGTNVSASVDIFDMHPGMFLALWRTYLLACWNAPVGESICEPDHAVASFYSFAS